MPSWGSVSHCILKPEWDRVIRLSQWAASLPGLSWPPHPGAQLAALQMRVQCGAAEGGGLGKAKPGEQGLRLGPSRAPRRAVGPLRRKKDEGRARRLSGGGFLAERGSRALLSSPTTAPRGEGPGVCCPLPALPSPTLIHSRLKPPPKSCPFMLFPHMFRRLLSSPHLGHLHREALSGRYPNTLLLPAHSQISVSVFKKRTATVTMGLCVCLFAYFLPLL